MSLLAIHGAAVVQVHMDDICHSYLDGQLLLLFVPRKDLADFSFELSFENCDLLSILFWNHCFDILFSKVLLRPVALPSSGIASNLKEERISVILTLVF